MVSGGLSGIGSSGGFSSLTNLGNQLVEGAFGVTPEDHEKPKPAQNEGIDWGDDEPEQTPEQRKKFVGDKMRKAEGNMQLDLSNSGLEDIPQAAVATHALHLSIVNFNLNYNYINRFPRALPAFRLLQRLYLDGNYPLEVSIS